MPSNSAATPAFHVVASRLRPELFHAACRLSRSTEEAEDIVQEALARAYVHWSSFESGTNVRAWLHRILRNTFIDGVRRRQSEQRAMASFALEAAAIGPDAPRMEDGADARALVPSVAAALDALPAEYREVVVLVGLRDHTYQEAADALRVPIGTVMSRLHRARQRMRSRLGSAAVAPLAA